MATGTVTAITSVGGTVSESTSVFIVFVNDLGTGRFRFGADDEGLRFEDLGTGRAQISTAGTYVGMALNNRVSLRTY